MGAPNILTLGRYEAVVRLGRGGMAEVFAGRLRGEAGFAKLVALKRMLPHLRTEAGLVARFLEEARLAALIASPHVVSTLDLGRDADGSPFIVLELVIGVTLDKLLKPSAGLPLRDRLELVRGAGLGLADVHDTCGPEGAPLGVVHRDVSPQNVLVGLDGRARLADFGIAWANIERQPTATGVILGKAGYMAPEQLRGGAVDARTDVYALGVVLFEAAAGRRLHGGGKEGRSPSDVATRVLEGNIPPLRWVAPAVPERVAQVAARALALAPADRYPDARAMVEDLTAALAEMGPPSPRAALVEGVSRAGGEELARLERVLRAARSTEAPATDEDEAPHTGTASLTFEDATVSGLVGDRWSPSAETAPLPDPVPTRVDPRGPAVARPRGARRAWMVVALIGGVSIAAGAGLATWLRAAPSPSRSEKVSLTDAAPAPPSGSPPALPEPPTEEAPPTEAPPTEAPPTEAPVVAPRLGESEHAAPRARRRAVRDPAVAPTPPSPPTGGLVGLDRFDAEER